MDRKVNFETFTRIFKECPSMVVMLTYGDDYIAKLSWYQWIMRAFLKNVFYPAVYAYQDKMFGPERCKAVHAMVKVLDTDDGGNMTNEWFSYTFPVAVIETPALNPKCHYKLVAWSGAGVPAENPEGWRAFYDTLESMEGKPYDFLDDVRMFAAAFLGRVIPDLVPQWRVCSTSVARAYQTYWEKMVCGKTAPPFGDIPIEEVPPAAFENLPNWYTVAEYDPTAK